MAAVHKKELLVWYVITLKLRETVESRLPRKSTCGDKIVPDFEPRGNRSLARAARKSALAASQSRVFSALEETTRQLEALGPKIERVLLKAKEHEWIVSIEKKLDEFCQDNLPVTSAKHCMYRFPHNLKYGDDKAWVPQIVSLGPYHHGEEHLRYMERHKWRCLHHILKRYNLKIGLYLCSMRKVERRARAYYEGTISMSSNEFVEMMVLDGCFVIQLLLGYGIGFEKLGYSPKDPVFSCQELMLHIQRDMIMLENQIPLFILDRLLGLQLGEPNQKGRVAKLVIQYFSPLLQRPDLNYGNLSYHPLYGHGWVHCLEAYQRDILFLGLRRPKIEGQFNRGRKLIPCLTELREAGIQIRVNIAGSNFLDIQFEKALGILRIPCIGIHDGTRSLFLNLIAFGQSHFGCPDHITSYVIFMHNLINSPEDVRYLCKHDIIEHSLASDAEVADLFNQLCRGVAFDIRYSYLLDINEKVRNYLGKKSFLLYVSRRTRLAQKWNAWRAILKRKYFDSPWSIISVVAAFVLLVLTFIQTLYAVYGYNRPSS